MSGDLSSLQAIKVLKENCECTFFYLIETDYALKLQNRKLLLPSLKAGFFCFFEYWVCVCGSKITGEPL